MMVLLMRGANPRYKSLGPNVMATERLRRYSPPGYWVCQLARRITFRSSHTSSFLYNVHHQ